MINRRTNRSIYDIANEPVSFNFNDYYDPYSMESLLRKVGCPPPKEEKKPEEGFVYFILSENGTIKIGKSKDPIDRLKALQTSSSEKLTLLGYIPLYVSDEKYYHKLFKSLHIRGEWFIANNELLDYIKERRHNG